MKKIAVLIILLMGIKGFSQHPELLDKEWFLYKFVIEEEEIVPPVNTEVGDVTINFNTGGFITSVCTILTTYTTYNGGDSFFIDEAYITPDYCMLEENQPFNFLNLSFFTDYIEYDFEYEITIVNDEKKLVIYNANGHEGHYGSVPLSTEDFNTTTVSIYPNPVKELLFIESKENLSSITVFDIHGKKVKTVSDLSEINLGGLQSGVYFVSITSENGGVLTQKIVKK